MVAWWFKDDSGQEFEQDIGDENISDFLKSPAGGRLSPVRQSDYTDSPWANASQSGLMQSGDPNTFQQGQGVQQTGGPSSWFGEAWDSAREGFGALGDAGGWLGDKAQGILGAGTALDPSNWPYDFSTDPELQYRQDMQARGIESGFGSNKGNENYDPSIRGRGQAYADYWDQFMAGGSGRNETLEIDPNTGKSWSTARPNVHGGFDRGALFGDDESLYQQGQQRSGTTEQVPVPFGGAIPDFTQKADIDPDNPAADPDAISGFIDPDATSWEDKDWDKTPPTKEKLDTDNSGDLDANDMTDANGEHDPNAAQGVISRVVYDAPDYETAIQNLQELLENIPPDDYGSRTAAFQAIGQLYLESITSSSRLEGERIAANPFGITPDQFMEEQAAGRKAPLDIATQDRLGREAQFNADQARLTAESERDRANRLSIAEQGTRMAEAQEGGMVGAAEAQFNPFGLGATPGDAYATGEVDEFNKPVMHQPLSGPQQQQMLARGGLTTDQRLAEINAQGRPDMINSILGLLGNPAAMGSLQGLFGGAEGQPMQNQNFPAIPTISSLRNSPENTLQFLQGLFGTQGVNPDQLQNLIRSVSPGAPGGGGQQRQQLGSSF